MKKIIFIVFVLLKTIGLMAQTSRFKDGETLNVWATSGLNMRDKPDATAKKLVSIPYGAKVVVQPNIGVKIPFEVEEFKGFIVKGYWLLVKYGDKEGFVFDGFLSRLPAPNKDEVCGFEDGYLTNKIGKIGQKYEVTIWDMAIDNRRSVSVGEKYELKDVNHYKQKFNFNILLDYDGGECSSISVEFPNLTLYEGYFLVKTYLFEAKTDVFKFDKQHKSVEMSAKDEGAGCYYSVKQVGFKIILSGGCCC
jgi:hypothetical protein